MGWFLNFLCSLLLYFLNCRGWKAKKYTSRVLDRWCTGCNLGSVKIWKAPFNVFPLPLPFPPNQQGKSWRTRKLYSRVPESPFQFPEYQETCQVEAASWFLIPDTRITGTPWWSRQSLPWGWGWGSLIVRCSRTHSWRPNLDPTPPAFPVIM